MKIVTDSAADLTAQEAEENDVAVAPLYIQFPGKEVNSNEISADDFYRRLEAMQPAIPTTAQPSEHVFHNLYQKIAAAGEDILSIHISSGLSGTINSARLAAEQCKECRTHIVDSLTLSGGQRFQVLAAAWLARQGNSLQAILERLDEIRKHTEVAYTLETLKYLARGGRIGRVQALAGSLLNIKPVITVDHKDGKYNNTGRARTIHRALEQIAVHLAEKYNSGESLWVTVMHGNFPAPAEEMAILLKEKLNVGKLEVLRISPVLGVHTGPGVVGAAVVPMRLMPQAR